jgi:SAM-dependent methyltransferase
MMSRRDAPATHRNRDPILEVLARWLTDPARVLEIASGTGQHAIYFARFLSHVSWQPSDADPDALASIGSWIADEGPSNVANPIELDASAATWPTEVGAHSFDAIFNANMIHISPWRVAEGLFEGAGRVLCDEGVVFLYGPFFERGRAAAPSNIAFDEDLRRRNPEWGIRHLEAIEDLARRAGLGLVEKNEMPANNKLIVFRKLPDAAR